MKSWEDFEVQLRSVSLRHSAGELSKQDRHTLASVLLQWVAVVDDLANAQPPMIGLAPTYRVELIVHDLLACMRSHTVDTFFDVLKGVDEGIHSLSFRSASDISMAFKQLLDELPRGYRWLSRAVFDHIGWQNPINGFRLVHQVCAFCLRVNITQKAFEDKALEDWLSVYTTISDRCASASLSRIVEEWMGGCDLQSVKPRHGSGAVFIEETGKTTSCKALKYHHSIFTPIMDYVNQKYCGGRLIHPFGKFGDIGNTASWRVVPKSYSKARSIAFEPPGKMWYQQAGFVLFNEHFKTHPYLRRRIDLQKSEYNRELARQGSIGGDLVTIDLSSASDYLSWTLVQSCFRRTSVYPLIVSARTRYIQVPKLGRLEAKSSSPMGSALCFPIQCVIFAAIVEESIARCGGSPVRSRFRVYGDDIVVERRYASTVMERLEYYGFVVNRNKTFTDCAPLCFRESCGGEFINGCEVDPLRVSRFYHSSLEFRPTPEQYEANIEMANRAQARGYLQLRRIVLKELLRLDRYERPIFVEIGQDGGVQSEQPTNYHLRVHEALSADYQRTVYVHGVVSDRYCDDILPLELMRFYETLVQLEHRPPERDGADSLPATVMPRIGTRLRSNKRSLDKLASETA